MARMAEKGAKSRPHVIKNQIRIIKIPGNPGEKGANASQKQLHPRSAHRCFTFVHHFGSRLPLISQQRITNKGKKELGVSNNSLQPRFTRGPAQLLWGCSALRVPDQTKTTHHNVMK